MGSFFGHFVLGVFLIVYAPDCATCLMKTSKSNDVAFSKWRRTSRVSTNCNVRKAVVLFFKECFLNHVAAQYESTLIKLSNAETQVEDLKLQLDDAMGAEELLVQLTERNLQLGEVGASFILHLHLAKHTSFTENRGNAHHDRRSRSPQRTERRNRGGSRRNREIPATRSRFDSIGDVFIQMLTMTQTRRIC